MLKNLLKSTLLTLSLSLFAMGSANANFVTQDILFDDGNTTEVVLERIGTITIETTDADEFGLISSWVNFELFGFDMITEDEANGDFSLFGLFEALVDVNNLKAGIEFISFDVTESQDNFFNFQGLVDTASGSSFFVDAFDFSGGLYAFGDLSLGEASVVPEPSVFLLFLTGLIFMVAKRRKL